MEITKKAFLAAKQEKKGSRPTNDNDDEKEREGKGEKKRCEVFYFSVVMAVRAPIIATNKMANKIGANQRVKEGERNKMGERERARESGKHKTH